MCTYLAKRGATYYFRRPVPAELRPYLENRREWMVSLGTKDRETAKRKIPEHTMATDGLIDGARDSLERDRAKALAGVPGYVETPPAPSVRIPPGDAERAQYDAEQAIAAGARWEARKPERLSLRERLATLRSDELSLPEQAARDLIREREAIHLEFIAERREQGAANVAADAARASQPVPLLEVFEGYAKEQQLKPTTIQEWRGNIRALIDFLGHEDAKRITVEDLDRWRDHLQSGITKRGTIRSPRTVKSGYFTPLRATLTWAVEKRKLPENVAAMVVVRIPKAAKLRDRDFTKVECQPAWDLDPRSASNIDPAASILPMGVRNVGMGVRRRRA